jgi:subtilisin family serine protease
MDFSHLLGRQGYKGRRGDRRYSKRLCGFEKLEDRKLLAGDSFGSELIVPFSDEGIPDGQPIDTTTEPSHQVITFDQGEFYYVVDDQIALRRIANEVLVRVEQLADTATVVSALTGSGGALEGFTPTYLDTKLVTFAAPVGQEVQPLDQLLANSAAQDGVEWSAPVFVDVSSGSRLWLTGEIFVALNSGVDPADFFATGYSSWQRFIENQYIATPENSRGLGALSLANSLHSDSRVDWATPNFFTDHQIEAVPNDTLFGNQWTMNNTGQTGALNNGEGDTDSVQAWDTTTGNAQLVVAVLDNGVQLDHPDLNIFTNTGEIAGNGIDDDGNGFIDDVNGWDFAGDVVAVRTPDNNPNPTTANDNHGTAVAGVVGAIGNNGVGIAGSIQNVQILPVKIARDDTGTGGGFVDQATISRAVYYAAGAVLDVNDNIIGRWRGADILVNSWAGGAQNAALNAAFDWAATHGRNELGIASFNATGNAAAGTQAGLNYSTLTLTGVPAGNWIFEWRYTKNATNATGEDSAWIANVRFPTGARERFDAPGLPAGWTAGGNVVWSVVDDPGHTYATGRYVAQAGVIGNNQTSTLRSPLINVGAAGNLSFSYWVSSETGADGIRLFASNNGGAIFTEQWNFSGVPLVTSAVSYPSNRPSVIAVGANSDWDYRSAYSQYGEALDVVAPSNGGFGAVYTTDRTGNDGYNAAGVGDPGADPLADTNYTSAFGGTSAATPLTAGIGLLLLSRNPDLTSTDIRNILQNTAEKIGGNNGQTAYDVNGFNQYYGFGRVNADTSVDAVPGASGDYNRNGAVDAADYVVWRKTNGTAVASAYAGADGSGNVNVGSEDYTVWRAHFGQTITPPGPGSGGGSGTSESALAASSQVPHESPAPLAPAKDLTEAISVAPAELMANSIHPGLFQPTITASRRATVPSALMRHGHGVTADITVRQDEGLLAWLSASSMRTTKGDIDFGDNGGDFLAEDTVHRDIADNALGFLVPSLRSTAKLLVQLEL